MNGICARKALLLVLLVGMPTLLGVTAPAQEASTKTLKGQVLDEDGSPAAAVIVHLKNRSTKKQLSVVTNKEGRYVFSDLDPKADYEVFAELKGKESRKRRLSQFDTRETIFINLQLAPAKESEDEGKSEAGA